jgi:hypothetical protein
MTIQEIEQNLKIIQDFVNKLPKPAFERRNILEIAGYPSWENVMSNLLAFYFDENEQHNFGRAIFNALIVTIKLKEDSISDLPEDNYIVSRETDRIDILLTSSNRVDDKADWAILIENKINAGLYNDLGKYWKKTNAKTKIGIVLSIKPVGNKLLKELTVPGVSFVNILYSEFVTEIKNILPALFEKSDDRHLLYLKDFIENILTFYDNPMKTNENDEKLAIYQKNIETINRVEDFQKEIKEYVAKTSFKAFDEFRYRPASTALNVQGKHFYYHEAGENPEPNFNKFRFYLDYTELIESNNLVLYFELFNENTKHGDEIKKSLPESEITKYPHLNVSLKGGIGSPFFHIAVLKCSMDDIKGGSLEEKLNTVIGNTFFKGEMPFVKRCAELIK